jgi:hypothetical protein
MEFVTIAIDTGPKTPMPAKTVMAPPPPPASTNSLLSALPSYQSPSTSFARLSLLSPITSTPSPLGDHVDQMPRFGDGAGAKNSVSRAPIPNHRTPKPQAQTPPKSDSDVVSDEVDGMPLVRPASPNMDQPHTLPQQDAVVTQVPLEQLSLQIPNCQIDTP